MALFLVWVIGGMALMKTRLQVETLEDRMVLSPTSLSESMLATRVPFGITLAMHIHIQLNLVIDNLPVTIPANIGVGQSDATLIHTHDSTGLIHVESPFTHDYVLEDFFYIWAHHSDQGSQ